MTDLKKDIVAARDYLRRLCAGERLLMKIPAHEDDYDLVFSRIIEAAEKSLSLPPVRSEKICPICDGTDLVYISLWKKYGEHIRSTKCQTCKHVIEGKEKP